jgi:hypothetical protein
VTASIIDRNQRLIGACAFSLRIRLVVVRTIVLTACCFIAVACPLAGQGNARPVMGTVEDLDGRPVPDAIVVLFQGGNRTRMARTSPKGTFTIMTDGVAGAATLSAERMGYVQNDQSATVLNGSGNGISLQLVRSREKQGNEQIVIQPSRLEAGCSILACIIADPGSQDVTWKLERLSGGQWTAVTDAVSGPTEIYRYQYNTSDETQGLPSTFRLTAGVRYQDGLKSVSRTFIASQETYLLGDAP